MMINNADQSYAEHQIRASKIKAAAHAFLEQATSRKTLREISDGIKTVMDEVGYTNDSLRKMLETMADNEVINIERDEGHVFFMKTGSAKTVPRLRVVNNEIKQTGPNEYIFDVFANSGKLRITHQGVVEEGKIKGPLTFKVGDDVIVLNVLKE